MNNKLYSTNNRKRIYASELPISGNNAWADSSEPKVLFILDSELKSSSFETIKHGHTKFFYCRALSQNTVPSSLTSPSLRL